MQWINHLCSETTVLTPLVIFFGVKDQKLLKVEIIYIPFIGKNELKIVIFLSIMIHKSYVLKLLFLNLSVVFPKSSCDVHLFRGSWFIIANYIFFSHKFKNLI